MRILPNANAAKTKMMWLLGTCIVFLFIGGSAEVVQMKIVDEITNYGYNFGGGPDSSQQLSAKVKPSNFSGPSHLKALKGQCFALKLNEYKYKFCPFDNVTQHEQTYRWNPYSGILGIWKEWHIVNNTFYSMLMSNGDSCGSETREAEVVLSCGRANNLTAVSEPKTCSYRLSFQTPLVCHEDSQLVYPRINKTLQKEWDSLEQELHDAEITAKGYEFFLQKIFWRAGLVSNPEEKSKKDNFKPYESLDTCNEVCSKACSDNPDTWWPSHEFCSIAPSSNIHICNENILQEYKKLLEEVQRLRKSQTAS